MELTLTKKQNLSGWIGIGSIALTYLALYLTNYALPLDTGNYTTRIWAWSQIALTLAALVVVIQKRRFIAPGAIFLGLALGLVSGLAHSLHDPSFPASILEGIGVWACLLAGVTLFKELQAPGIPVLRPPLEKIVRSVLFGAAVAIPLAAINNLYFYLNAGAIHFEGILASAFAALSPAIHEEIIFRFFVLALCFALVKSVTSSQLRMAAAFFLAVVPHSLNHLPDLFLQNPLMALFMLAATSLLFGLPMALLQVKKNLEAAIAFHWFIDFARFLFGF